MVENVVKQGEEASGGQTAPQTAPVAPTVPSEPKGGLDEKIDTVLKALADLQSAIKDLAVTVGSGVEANRGLAETLNQVKSSLPQIISEELKKFAVGFREAASESKAGDKLFRSSTPQAVGEAVQTPASSLKEPAEHLYQKEAKTVETPRVTEVQKVPNESTEEEIIKGILSGKVKAVDLLREGIVKR